MNRGNRRLSLWALAAVFGLVGWPIAPAAVASTIVLKDGRVLQGTTATLPSLAEDPRKTQTQAAYRLILLIDDDLRRVFVPKFQVRDVNESDAGQVLEKITIPQRVAQVGPTVRRVGPIVNITPFDEHGRRTFTMGTDKAPLSVIQGITEITPNWSKVEGLAGQHPYVWDMRIATSSIPREILVQILARQIDPKNLDQRLKLVRLFLQSERYLDAQKELEEVIKDFPGQEQLKTEVQALRQLHARRIVDEIKLRRATGQHGQAKALLEKFPTDNVAGETLQQIREMLNGYNDQLKTREDAINDLGALVQKVDDTVTRTRCQLAVDEIKSELNLNTLDRMASFIRLNGDPKLSPADKVALAISGWLVGSSEAITNLPVALSLFDTRRLVRQYMGEREAVARAEVIHRIQAQEGGAPTLIAGMIKLMKPPLEISPSPNQKGGYYTLQIPGIDKEPDVTYHVQLPPEYDPYRRYPTVITLHGAGTTALQQLDWWAGANDDQGVRIGQAGRYGYIVMAVEWAKPSQKEYQYSAREHAAVLGSLRDACRRFSIDTDRVFLSGHSMGGDAAWDIGLAHPDLWAGVIPIVARSDKYCALYWENASELPFYFVGGELDGDKTVNNARDFDRYMLRRYDVTVVEYQGRGHEHFFEEIQRIFDWMSRKERNFFPKKFEVSSMRAWDNFFWWLEVTEFPPRGMVDPADWPPGKGYLPVKIEANVGENNSISVRSGARKVTVWLSPELLLDFNKIVRLQVNGRKVSSPRFNGQPDLSVLLEDVRTRAERQHPFWAKLE